MPAHLTEAQKTRAIAKLEDNWSLSEVAADLNVSKSCIYYIKKRWQEQQRLRRPIRQGIGKVSNEQEDNALVEFIHQNPFKTAAKAREETLFPGSVRTAQRRLKQSGLKNCAAARKVFLSNEHKQVRVQFANEMLNREPAFWNNVVFSDEKTFQSCDSDSCWYTDGSKTPEGAGAGVYNRRPRVEIADRLGQYATVFQAEIHAIELCGRELEKRGPNRRSIKIFSDSQAALKALGSYRCTSKAVWNCQQTLSRVGRTNRLILVWIPGHIGLKDNEVADSLAKRGVALEFIGSEPVLGLSSSTARTHSFEEIHTITFESKKQKASRAEQD
ncbi:hypothetical protein NQ315_015537 [Exocentrus adspersus]|uniref:ribonuclease H n=1 Tax=Exocentrus adspersus TaxID=1586481 RepID=A0AAV8VPM6_9CUCU|nr:hypothetical protein NQ315_015537 [Exocentrus adspersus]